MKNNRPCLYMFLVLTDVAEDCLNELKTKLEPWDEVTTLWNSTFSERRQSLNETDVTVVVYINKFACLSIQKNIDLVKYDFLNLT